MGNWKKKLEIRPGGKKWRRAVQGMMMPWVVRGGGKAWLLAGSEVTQELGPDGEGISLVMFLLVVVEPVNVRQDITRFCTVDWICGLMRMMIEYRGECARKMR